VVKLGPGTQYFRLTILAVTIQIMVEKCTNWSTVMRRFTTGIRSEKCVVRWFRRCANVI